MEIQEGQCTSLPFRYSGGAYSRGSHSLMGSLFLTACCVKADIFRRLIVTSTTAVLALAMICCSCCTLLYIIINNATIHKAMAGGVCLLDEKTH